MTFDRFTETSHVAAPPPAETRRRIGGGEFVMSARTAFPGNAPKKAPADALITFDNLGYAGWEFLRCHEVAALVDGKPFALPPAKHDGHVISGSTVLETITITLPWARFAAMAKAGTLEIRVCDRTVPINDEDRADWREIVRAASPPPRK